MSLLRLRVRLRSRLLRRRPRATRQSTAEAADLYLRGRFYWNQRTEVSLKQAIEYFEQAIARAPAYAPAYAALADCYAAMVYSCYLAPATGFAQARALPWSAPASSMRKRPRSWRQKAI